MKKLILIVLSLCVNPLIAQYTLIPDAEFEQRLITQGIDTEGTLDGQVLTDDIDHITILAVDTLFPEIFPTISDLTGIEDFISLEYFYFGSNTVEQADLSNNINLKSLVCKYNNLTGLDITNNVLLEVLDLANCFPGTCDQENTFTEIDLSNNANLRTFFSHNNHFSELDFSNNPQLESLSVSYSSTITSLDIKNGSNIILNVFNAIENPNLTCITVDDPVAAANGSTPPYNNWNVQEEVNFSEDCNLGITNYLTENTTIYPNPVKNMVYLENNSSQVINTIKVYDVLGRLVIQQSNPINQLDVSNLSSGLLFVHLETEKGVVVKKVVKE